MNTFLPTHTGGALREGEICACVCVCVYLCGCVRGLWVFERGQKWEKGSEKDG